MDNLLFDLRCALRGMSKKPAFTAMLLLILAMGIGLNTAIFSIAYNVLLKPLSYSEPEKLVRLWPGMYVNKLIAAHVAEQTSVFEAVSAYLGGLFPISGTGEPAIVKGARVGVEHFEVLKAAPLLGRTFSAEEQRPGNERVAVLSNGLWRRRYGADQSIIGRRIMVDGQAHTIIGVMSRDFQPLEPGWELWLPLVSDPANEKDFTGSFYLNLVGRLKPGVSAESADAAIRTVIQNIRADHPDLITDEIVVGAKAVLLHGYVVSSIRPTLVVLLGSVAFVLLITCANVANLLLTRAIQRQREVAVRVTVGATRGRLMREILTESVVLGVIGGVAGLVVAYLGMKILMAQLPATMPRIGEIDIDAPVLAFNLCLSLVTSLIFGLWPARRALRVNLQSELKEGGSGAVGARSRRSNRFLVAAQVATASVLLIGAGLLLRSFWRLQAVDPGFESSELLSFRLDVPQSEYSNNPQLIEYFRRVLEQIQSLPGIAHAGAIHLLPLTADNWNFPFVAEDNPIRPSGSQSVSLPMANFRVVTPEYFSAMGVRLIEGRFFSAADHADAPAVGLINHAMATQLWPGRSAVGKTIQLFGEGGPLFTVVGVVEDVHQHRLDTTPSPEMYRPYPQWPIASMYVAVRTNRDPGELAPALRSAIWKIDPNIPISEMRTGEEIVRASTTDERLVSIVTGVFAALALLLSLIGIYGVISYAVEQRTHEVGIRMAVGAQRQEIFRQIVREGIALTFAGLVFGLGAALAFTRIVASRLYETPATDVVTYLAVALLMIIAAVGSSGLPAWRAAKIEPASALNYE